MFFLSFHGTFLLSHRTQYEKATVGFCFYLFSEKSSSGSTCQVRAGRAESLVGGSWRSSRYDSGVSPVPKMWILKRKAIRTPEEWTQREHVSHWDRYTCSGAQRGGEAFELSVNRRVTDRSSVWDERLPGLLASQRRMWGVIPPTCCGLCTWTWCSVLEWPK
jgi:hypothetical protein